jgi:LacI family transcriptional regulator
VASAAGVSPYTVSVVLNDPAYGRVSTAVRERVRRVADELGYRPQAAGRALRLGRSELVAYVTSPQLLHEVSSYHGALVPTLLTAANEAGLDLAIVGDDSPAQLVARVRRALQAGRYDGVIVGRPRIVDPLLDVLASARVPFVLAGAHPDTAFYQVRRDDDAVGREMGERLRALGHRRVGFVGEGNNVRDYEYARARLDALRAALSTDGGGAGGAGGGEVCELPEEPAAAVEVARLRRLTAVVAENDRLAVALIEAARRAGSRVPGDLSVASLYGVRAPLACTPALASVCVDPADAGRAAMHLLASLIAGSAPVEREVFLSSWCVAGASLGPPDAGATQDRWADAGTIVGRAATSAETASSAGSRQTPT